MLHLEHLVILHLLIILPLLILCRGVLVTLVCCWLVALLLPRFLTALPRQLGNTQIATTSEMWVSSKVVVSLQVHKNRFRYTLASLSVNTLQVGEIADGLLHLQRLITAQTLSCIWTVPLATYQVAACARSEHYRMSMRASARTFLNFHCRRVPISYHMLQAMQSLKVPTLLSISSFSISRTRFVSNEKGYWIVVYQRPVQGLKGVSISRSIF